MVNNARSPSGSEVCRSTRSHHWSGGGRGVVSASGAEGSRSRRPEGSSPHTCWRYGPLASSASDSAGLARRKPLTVGDRGVQVVQRGAEALSGRPAAGEGDGQQLGCQRARAGAPQHDQVVAAGQQPADQEQVVPGLGEQLSLPGDGRPGRLSSAVRHVHGHRQVRQQRHLPVPSHRQQPPGRPQHLPPGAPDDHTGPVVAQPIQPAVQRGRPGVIEHDRRLSVEWPRRRHHPVHSLDRERSVDGSQAQVCGSGRTSPGRAASRTAHPPSLPRSAYLLGHDRCDAAPSRAR